MPTAATDKIIPTLKHQIKKVPLPLLIISVALLLFFLLVFTRPSVPAKPTAETIWQVTTHQLITGDYGPNASLFGTVESPERTTLSAPLTAWVEKLIVREGDSVKAGDTLLQLDLRDVQLQLRQREAEVKDIEARIAAEETRHASNQESLKTEQRLNEIAKQTLERYLRLRERLQISELQLDEAKRAAEQQALALTSRKMEVADHPNRLAQLQAQLARAVAVRDQAQLDLERSQLKAPFNGRVTALQVAPGDRVSTGNPLLTLFNLDALEVRALIPNPLLPQIQRLLSSSSQPIIANANVDGGQVTLRLKRLAAEVNTNRGGIEGLFVATQGSEHLQLGRPIEINMQLPPLPDSFPIPVQAIYGADRIYLVEDERLQAVQIERLGEWQGNNETHILVRAPELKAGGQVLSMQIPTALSGLKVKIVGNENATAKESAQDKNAVPNLVGS